MEKTQTVFNIIRFTPDKRRYYPASIQLPDILQGSGEYVKHTDLRIPPGHSRYGGPVVDLPPGLAYPADLLFAAQLDLTQIAPHDKSGLLPTSGYLFFFANIYEDRGAVFYADVPSDLLIRTIKEHEDNFWEGTLITQFFADTESLTERIDTPALAEDDLTGWDYFAGTEKSKLFGIYTDCQLEQEDIEEITFSDDILLLQVGADFNEEGVFSVLISRDDLHNRKFSNCRFSWSQS